MDCSRNLRRHRDSLISDAAIVKSASSAYRIRLVFLITGLDTGGAEVMLHKLCSRIDRQRFAPMVISLGGKGKIGPRIEKLGIPVHALGMPRYWPWSALLTLKRLLAVHRTDLIQGWMYHGNIVASLVAGTTPVCWGIRQSLYGLENERALTRWVIRVGARISRFARLIVYNSRISAYQHERFGYDATRALIIPNGFDTDLLRPDGEARSTLRGELGLTEDVCLIGMIARYHPMKDHESFLSAAALISRQHPDVYFLLSGRGIDNGNRNLLALIEQGGLSGRVFLLGERADVPRLNAALDIASSTSAWGEGFANIIGEAMSCCVPCVVTDVGDSAWIVGDTGKVVPPRAPEALAAAWKELIGIGIDGRNVLGAHARQRVIDNFSLGTVVRQYESIYESVFVRVNQ